MDKLLDEQAKLQDAIDAANGWDLDRTLEIAMDALRLPAGRRRRHASSRAASGAASRCASCCCEQPDMLLLDEPTNHLDAESVAWLEQSPARVSRARSSPSRTIATSSTTSPGWILELDRGAGIPWKGNYSSWLEQKQKRLAERGEAGVGAAAHARARARVGARVAARAPGEVARRASPRTRSCWREESQKRDETIEISIPPGPRLGDVVVEAEKLQQGLRRQPADRGPDFHLPRGGIVGVIGPNGAGKTTLFRMIVGQEKPDGGDAARRRDGQARLRRSEPRRARRRQDASSRRSRSGAEILELGKRKIPAARLRRLASTSRAPTSRSGSRTSRAASATACTWPRCSRAAATCCCSTSRPTTSTSTRCARSKRRCSHFAGCAVVISHDRWFLDRIATHILAFEGDSQVVWFEGNYQDYEADRKRRLGAAADQPHRIRYKKLIH